MASDDPRQLRFNETEKEAIADDIKALGGPKPAAAVLQPGKSPERGADLMRAWANPSRQEEPSLDEIIQLVEAARARAGYSEVIRYIEQRLNCRVEFLTVEDEIAKLQRECIAATEQQTRNAERMERAVERLAQLQGRK
jgi:hypothetical protein